jgi:hypothetical protein
MTGFMSSIMDNVYTVCTNLGLVGYATSCCSEALIGVGAVHPTLLVGIVVSGVLAKIISHKLTES